MRATSDLLRHSGDGGSEMLVVLAEALERVAVN